MYIERHMLAAALKQVQKAEGMQHKNWWTYRPPTKMTLEELQQLAASKLGTATASGVAAGVANSAPQVQASAGPAQQSSGLGAMVSNVTMALVQRWILAEVGLAAQQQLSAPNMQPQPPPQVRAADYATDSDTSTDADGVTSGAGVPQMTAQVAAVGIAGQANGTVSNQQPVGSKNQDPGIKVDPRAVAKPGGELWIGTAAPHTMYTYRLVKVVLSTLVAEGWLLCANDTCYNVHRQTCGGMLNHADAGCDHQFTTMLSTLLHADIIVRTTGDSSSTRSDSSQDLQQPLPLAAAQQANTEPGVKEQRLVTALWNLDRIDQQQLPLNSTFSYGSSTAAGTGERQHRICFVLSRVVDLPARQCATVAVPWASCLVPSGFWEHHDVLQNSL
jgi:hypothetical protein